MFAHDFTLAHSWCHLTQWLCVFFYLTLTKECPAKQLNAINVLWAVISVIICACVVWRLKLGTRGQKMFIAYICGTHVFYICWKRLLKCVHSGYFYHWSISEQDSQWNGNYTNIHGPFSYGGLGEENASHFGIHGSERIIKFFPWLCRKRPKI